ncbi:hypothetical protein D6829_02665 [Candidatus Pacearchaeota archaeon]|nr:MAG: hypothetical protein D6829_02665 [Candidatus Pacearchaeota archaeon]
MEGRQVFSWIVSEVAFFVSLYYIQYLLRVEGNLFISSAILFVLLNVAIVFCPALGKCRCKKSS